MQLKQKPTQPSGPQRLLIFLRQTSKRGMAGGGIQGASAAPKAPPEGPRAAAEHAQPCARNAGAHMLTKPPLPTF